MSNYLPVGEYCNLVQFFYNNQGVGSIFVSTQLFCQLMYMIK